jgi:hypothetical protein
VFESRRKDAEEMKVILAIAIVLFFRQIYASPGVYACQDTNSAGLEWASGRWKTTDYFAEKKFFLKIEENRLTVDSVKSLGGLGVRTTCGSGYKTVEHGVIFYCSDYSDMILFNPSTGTGSRSGLFGSVVSGQKRDSVFVVTFVCQKM